MCARGRGSRAVCVGEGDTGFLGGMSKIQVYLEKGAKGHYQYPQKRIGNITVFFQGRVMEVRIERGGLISSGDNEKTFNRVTERKELWIKRS